jgi:serine/threonine protein kinase
LAIKSFADKQEALVEVTAYSSLPPHPSVLQLLDVVALSNNRLGLVFPRYDQNLRDLASERQAGCRAGALERAFELEELQHCALCLGRGLEHVHAHGLTHTDLKPDNVLVVGGGLAKVAPKDFVEALRQLPLKVVIADFGLAQLADPGHRALPSSKEVAKKVASFNRGWASSVLTPEPLSSPPSHHISGSPNFRKCLKIVPEAPGSIPDQLNKYQKMFTELTEILSS